MIPILRPKLMIVKFGHVFEPTQQHIMSNLARHFSQFHVVKPLQSKPWNSELYLVYTNYAQNCKPYPSNIVNYVSSYAVQCSVWNNFFLRNLHIQQPFSYPFTQPNESEYPSVTPFVNFK
jgi:hypothetical protein